MQRPGAGTEGISSGAAPVVAVPQEAFRLRAVQVRRPGLQVDVQVAGLVVVTHCRGHVHVDAAEGIYQADTSWYIGADLMHGYYFASAMNNLTSSFNSVMNEARMDGMSQATGGSSGFSGFSGGGGFGGGGGGSW